MKTALLIFALAFSARAQVASFVGEISRYRDFGTASTTAITVSNSMSSLNTAVILAAWEATSAMTISSITDSRGNTWTNQVSHLISTVHQEAVLSSYLTTTLRSNDTITINWAGAENSARFGSLCCLTNATNAPPHLTFSTNKFGTTVSAPATTTVSNTLCIGMLQCDQTDSPVYSGSAWTQIGSADNYGEGESTVGLQNVYFYTNATSPATYNPGGSYGGNKSWQSVWVSFLTGTNPIPVVISGSVANVGTIVKQ